MRLAARRLGPVDPTEIHVVLEPEPDDVGHLPHAAHRRGEDRRRHGPAAFDRRVEDELPGPGPQVDDRPQGHRPVGLGEAGGLVAQLDVQP